jgi:hypothetical protein
MSQIARTEHGFEVAVFLVARTRETVVPLRFVGTLFESFAQSECLAAVTCRQRSLTGS